MDDLYGILAEISFELSEERMKLIADKLSQLQYASEINKIKYAWGPNFNRILYDKFIALLNNYPHLTGRELAIAFRSAASVVHLGESKGSQELIWTGPATSNIAIRQTEQVLVELIHAAMRNLFIVSFVAKKAYSIIEALKDALQRNVNVNILLESSIDHSEIIQGLPSANFYMWNPSCNPNSACVHAKCAVADDAVALITSANLTGMAMNSNMELGVLIHNGALPRQLRNHLVSLCTEEIIIKYQPNSPLSE